MGAVTGETQPTLPAPKRHPLKETWRVPTPPSAAAVMRRSEPPTARDSSDQLGPSSGRAGDREAILERELTKTRAEVAELERRERVRLESQGPGPYQPPVERKPSPVPSSAPSKTDAAIGLTVRTLLGKAAPFLLAAAGIGGGVTAVARPSADPAKTDAVLASQEAMRADVSLLREQVAGMLKREAARDQYTRCLEESLDEIGEQLLPAQDRLTNASPLRAYAKRCQRLRP
jgi:hypothetical protein